MAQECAHLDMRWAREADDTSEQGLYSPARKGSSHHGAAYFGSSHWFFQKRSPDVRLVHSSVGRSLSPFPKSRPGGGRRFAPSVSSKRLAISSGVRRRSPSRRRIGVGWASSVYPKPQEWNAWPLT